MDSNNGANGIENFFFSKSWSALNAMGTIGMRFESSETPASTRQFIQVGAGGDNRLTFAVTTGGNVGCDIIGNDIVNRPTTTANDTNTCCAGGTATCAGNMFDGVPKTVECVWDNDEQKMYVDGCLVDSGTGTWAGTDVFDWTAATEPVRMGPNSNFRGYDVHVSLLAITATKTKDYHSLWSGGDGTMNSGNECWNHDD